jgi:hypothetical protein
MKIFCKELNQEFVDKESMFIELVKNESKIVELKKATIKESDSVSTFFELKQNAEKKLSFVKEGFVYPVINTTNFLDSHGDVHFPNIWNKSLKDKSKKIFYVLEHKLSIDSVIAFPNDVTAFAKTVSWKDLGFDYQGETQALIYEIAKDKIKIPRIKELLEEKTSFENSVRMRYITMNLAVNSKNPDLSKNKALWDERIEKIVNFDKANEEGYFWAVDEASIEKEGSLCLFGSNSATPIIYEAVSDTSSKEAEESLQEVTRKKTFIN